MNREEFIGKLQMCYFGDRNAFDEIVSFYDELKDRIDKAVEKLYCWGEALNADFQQDMLKTLKRWENEMDQR